jgi:SSS family solute:Na+ symporter
VAVLKDVLMLGSILLVGALAIAHWNGAGAGMALRTCPLAPPAAGGGLPFAISTILLQAVGFAMIPQNWAFIFSARDPARSSARK